MNYNCNVWCITGNKKDLQSFCFANADVKNGDLCVAISRKTNRFSYYVFAFGKLLKLEGVK